MSQSRLLGRCTVIMPDDPSIAKPTFETYSQWYDRKFQEDLYDGSAEQWHENVSVKGVRDLQEIAFWKELHKHLLCWEDSFKAEHDNYPLLAGNQPETIQYKLYESTVNKAFRWNVRDNELWPNPPKDGPRSESWIQDRDPDDIQCWFGPHNWVKEFPDIFRVRLIATYFDGARYLAERIYELAKELGTPPPKIRYLAAPDGYHAIHVWVYHTITILDYETRGFVTTQVCFEIQVTTTIQETIGRMLHRVYEEWRLHEPPDAWQWDHRNSAFAVNYLGSTLHHLEGMIVVARQQGGAS